MKKNIKTFVLLSAGLVAIGLLIVGEGTAHAVGNTPSTLAVGATKARVNNRVSEGYPLAQAAKGVKVFGVDTATAVVVDQEGVAPTTGGLAALEIGVSGVAGIGQALPVCYLLVYDSSVGGDTTEAGSVSRLLFPPLMAGLSVVKSIEFAYPKQFHKGIVTLMGGVGAANCRGSIGWVRNGGQD